MTNLIKLKEDEFHEQYKPMENPEHSPGFYQFDAYDDKDIGFLSFMAFHYPEYVWTRIDGDDGCIYIINGWHIVNRIDYVVTEVPWQSDSSYEILDFKPDDMFDFGDLITSGVV